MMTYTIEHKFCGMNKTVEGYTIWDAFRNNNINPKMWNVVASEKK